MEGCKNTDCADYGECVYDWVLAECRGPFFEEGDE